MLHNWLSSLDCPGKFLRVCFPDFSKAFYHIDHTILVTKLINLGVRCWLISWICSFLIGRRQVVKLLDSISEWMPVHAGVHQGIKLGPILSLIMINDLATHSPLRSSRWKYVDDVTISEVPHYQQALAQANSTSLEDRRAHLCLKVWHNITNNPACQLHRLLPPVRSECHSHHIRNSSSSSRFQYRTKRFGSSFSQQWRKSTNQ